MDIVVNEELKAYIDPLTPEEHDALERSILAEGCRDALVLWGNVLVDGHNRYGICQKHGLPFQTVQNTRFQSMEDVHLWMIDQHLGRRSVSDFQRGVLALRKREIVAERRARSAALAAESATPAASVGANATSAEPPALPQEGTPAMPGSARAAPTPPDPAQTLEALETREALARVARLSSSQVIQIEKIQKQGAPELVAAVRAGMVSINAAAAVASLPAEEQAAAAAAGAAELKLAAKRVREARRRSTPASPADTPSTDGENGSAAMTPNEPSANLPPAPPDSEVETLRQRIASLEAENAALREEVSQLRARLPS